MSGLVLSLFPGIGLLDMAFELEGFCVVRGPDLLWGGDVRSFHPPSGKFDGVIGGPPCKAHSPLANVVRAVHGPASVAPDLIPEFERCISEARPCWFVMENVPRAPVPVISGFFVRDVILNARWCGLEQNRVRRFCFGTLDGLALHPETEVFEPINFEPAVTSNNGGRRATIAFDEKGRVRGKQGDADWHRLHRRPIMRLAELQGLPPTFLADAPFTSQGKREAIGNGVPLPMGRAVAKAVKAALA